MAIADIVALIQSNLWGAALLVFLVYQLYWPSYLHPSEPRLRALFERETVDRLVEIVVELACVHPEIDEAEVKKDFGVNGTKYRKKPRMDGGDIADSSPSASSAHAAFGECAESRVDSSPSASESTMSESTLDSGCSPSASRPEEDDERPPPEPTTTHDN